MRQFICMAVGTLVAILVAGRGHAEEPALEWVGTIPLPGVEGRIDHLAVDLKGQRLFVAALGNNTLEVLDLEQNKRLHSTTGLREPQGVVYLADCDRILVANGGDGTCRIFDGRTYGQIASISCGDDADNVRVDGKNGRIFVGYGSGALAEIDAVRRTRLGDISLAGHPESFQLETEGDRLLVNVPDARQIAVVDRQKIAVVARWPLQEFQANFPMALDEANRRVLVGCRKPARLVVLDGRAGAMVASVPCPGDTDDIFYDARLRRIYVSGGEGTISVIQQMDADHYKPLTTVPTAQGARTSLFVPSTHRLYLAVPHRGGQQAEIRAYQTSD